MRKQILLWTLTGAIGLPIVGITGTTMYIYPDLRYNYPQFKLAFMRVFRVIERGSQMAYIYLKPNQDDHIDIQHYQAAKLLKDAFQKNAGLYIKFGQVIASLDFIIPEPYRITFEPMCLQCPQSSNSSFHWERNRGHLPMQNPFNIVPTSQSDFEKIPISSASIAQVHRAILKDGREVAVKVQHPWLKEQCEGDIKLIEIFVDVAERIFTGFKYKWLAEELRENIPKELDFRAEKMLRVIPGIKVPDMYEDASNENMICMEFIDGTPLLHLDKLKQEKYDFKKIANVISTAFSYQLFEKGFVHSDPHQGNIMLRKVNGKQEVVLLDHGLYTQLEEDIRINFALLWKSIFEQDEVNLEKAAQGLGAGRDYRLFSSMITSKTFEQIMAKEKKDYDERLGKSRSKEEIEMLVRRAARKHKKITVMLSEINRKLLMLFKIQDFLRTIDSKLGNPINTYQITVKYGYVTSVIYEAELRKRSFLVRLAYRSKKLFNQMKLYLLKLYLQICLRY